MGIRRRISATYKDLPGGQLLGPTFDYTHRLIDPVLALPAAEPPNAPVAGESVVQNVPHVTGLLDYEGLIEINTSAAPGAPVGDLTREALAFPAGRDLRLQSLARGDEGFLLGLAYSTQRGYGRTHPFAGEVRMGEVAVELFAEELGFAVQLGEITVTEFETVNQFTGTDAAPPQFTRGYGLVLGHAERRAMSMALLDRALRSGELGEEVAAPAQKAEFVLSHCDNVAATGFVEHLKLPHYVDFQAELALIRQLRAEHSAARKTAEAAE